MGSSKCTSREVLESNKEQKWLYGWLRGEHHEEEIQQYLANVAPPVLNPKGAVVCVCSVDRELEDSKQSPLLVLFSNDFSKLWIVCIFGNRGQSARAYFNSI